MRRLILACLPLMLLAAPARAEGPRHGANLVQSPTAPLDGPEAARSLTELARSGADTVAFVPFLWQSGPASPRVTEGSAVSEAQLRAGIRAARALGLSVVLKPHVWVPGSWAGAIVMQSEDDWQFWFDDYQRQLVRLAEIAEAEKVELLFIGTELQGTAAHSRWRGLIRRLREVYSGRLGYVGHLDELSSQTFWNDLDVIGVTLYPALGDTPEPVAMIGAMRDALTRVADFAAEYKKPLWVAEFGLRSAAGGQSRPWESAEERPAKPDSALQAQVLGLWLAELGRAGIEGALIWRWLSDPAAGGPLDTDYTIQNKPAQGVALCGWTGLCSPGTAAEELARAARALAAKPAPPEPAPAPPAAADPAPAMEGLSPVAPGQQ